MSNFKDSKLYTVIFAFTATFVFVLILALVNSFTGEKVRINSELFKRKAVLNAFGITYTDGPGAYAQYDKYITQKEAGDNITVFESNYNNERLIGIITDGRGLWGTISAVVAFYDDLSTLKGLDFIVQNETPGLGGRIEEDWFKQQFVNEQVINNTIRLNTTGSATGDTDHTNSSFDGISGASRTSESIEDIINKSIKTLNTIKR